LLGPTPHAAARHLQELALIELFRQGEVSSGWAAEQLWISKTAFLDLLFRHDVAYFDMSEDELSQQVDERAWTAQFAATADDQWARMVEQVRRDVATGATVPLDDTFPPPSSER
jgi:predicted HTH domain antitoxin